MRLAITLLVTLFVTHYAGDLIAGLYANPGAAAKAWDYILVGAGFAVVLFVLGVLARNALAWPVVVWGMAEAGQRSVCRLARPIGGDPPEVAMFSGLCGVELYWLGLFAAAAIAFKMLDKLGDKKNG